MIDQFTWIELHAREGVVEETGTLQARFGRSVPDEQGLECGVSGGWKWDGGSLIVEADRHGYLPLYYHHGTNRIIVSDSPLTILERLERREIDPLALGFFCRAGFLIGDRTLFQGINRVPAAARMRWSDGRLEIEASPHVEASPPNSVTEALDGWIDRFQTAMKRRMPDDESFDLPLSGGRDSRMMLLELHRHGHLPRRTLSLGSPAGDDPSDVTLASRVAHRLGASFTEISPHQPDWVKSERDRHLACGFEALEHVWLLPLWNELLSAGMPWYDGLGAGSLTRNSAASPEMTELLRSGDLFTWSQRFFALTAATSTWWLEQIVQRAPFAIASTDEVLSDLEIELQRHLEAPNPITSFTFDNWGRRSIALNPFGICRSQTSIQLPFMDRDLLSWTRAVPVEMMHQNDLQTEACQRLYPEFSDIPFDAGIPPAVSKASLWLRYRRKRQKTRFFKENAGYFGTLPFKALGHTEGKSASHRALVLMLHLASVDSLLSGD